MKGFSDYHNLNPFGVSAKSNPFGSSQPETNVHKEINQVIESYISKFVSMKNQIGNKNVMSFYDTCCEMIYRLSKVVLSSSPIKLTSMNGQINEKCIFTEQSSPSIIEGSFDRSTPFGKTKIIARDKIMVVNHNSQTESTNNFSVTDFAKKLKLLGTIPKDEYGSDSCSRMIVDRLEKDGITWRLITPVRYTRKIAQDELEAEARFSNGYLRTVLINGNILFGKSRRVVLAVDERLLVVEYLSRHNNLITANGEVWKLNCESNRIEKHFIYLKNSNNF